MEQAGETRQSSTSKKQRPKVTLVLAGNYRQFLDWCRENTRTPYDRYLRYVTDLHHLYGYSPGGCEIIRYGTWYDHQMFARARRLDRQAPPDQPTNHVKQLEWMIEFLEGEDDDA